MVAYTLAHTATVEIIVYHVILGVKGRSAHENKTEAFIMKLNRK